MEKRIKVNLGITMSDIVFVILMWLIFVISFVNIEIMYRSSVKKIFLSILVATIVYAIVVFRWMHGT